MLSHESDVTTFLGRYSLTYAFQLSVMLVLMITFAGLAFLRSRGFSFDLARWLPRNRAAAWLVALGGGIGLVAYWAFFPGGRSQPGVMLFAVYSTSLLFALWLWLLHATQADERFILPSAGWLTVLGLVIIALFTWRLLGQVPPSLFLDEAWVANWGVSLYTLGRPVQMLMADMTPELTMRAPLFFIVMGAWLSAVGITLENARSFWVMLLWASLPFLYKSAQKLYGAAIAGLACVLAAALIPPHVYIRMDTVVAFFLAIGLWAWLRAEETQRPLWYGIAGFALALMFEGHQFPIVYDAAFALVVAYDYARLLWREKRWVWYAPFWAFAAGGLLGTALYLFLHSVPWGFGPIEWIQAVLTAYAGEQTSGSISVPERILRLTSTWMLDYLLYHPLESALFCAGIVWAFLLGDRPIRRLAVILILAQIGLFLVLPKRNPFYYVFNLPFTVLFAAGLIADLTGGWQEKRLSLARAATFIGVAALLMTQNLLTSQSNQNADAMIALSYEIDAVLPPDIQHIAAWQGYYFGFADRQFLNSEILYRLPEGKTLADLYYPSQPPQALLITRGLDDMQTELFDYIDQAGFVRVRCYPLDIFGKRADLYMHPSHDPYGGVTQCSA